MINFVHELSAKKVTSLQNYKNYSKEKFNLNFEYFLEFQKYF